MVQPGPPHPPLRQLAASITNDLQQLVGLLEATTVDTAESITESITEVEALGRLVDAARVRVILHLASDAAEAERLGFASTIAAVASLAQVSEQTARARLAVARATTPDMSIVGASLPAPCPRLAEALRAGQIGLDAAALLVRELSSVAPRVDRETLAVAESIMVNLSTGRDATGEHVLPPVSVDFLCSEVRQLAAAIDPDGARPREERAIRRRSLRIGTQDDDGLFPISGRLLPEVGIGLLATIEASRRSPRFVDTVDADQLASETDLRGSDPRTPEQRRHDALAEILIAAASADGAPRLDGQSVTVVVAVDESDLTNPNGLAGDPIGTMAGSRVPVSRGQLERFIDAGGLRRVIKNSDGAVTGIGLPERCFTNPQRLAIAARDGYRCSNPGCTSPHYALQVHHVVPDRDGGPTAVDNGILLCFWHHRRVDDGPWQYRMVHGLPQVRGPGVWEWRRLRPPAAQAA